MFEKCVNYKSWGDTIKVENKTSPENNPYTSSHGKTLDLSLRVAANNNDRQVKRIPLLLLVTHGSISFHRILYIGVCACSTWLMSGYVLISLTIAIHCKWPNATSNKAEYSKQQDFCLWLSSSSFSLSFATKDSDAVNSFFSFGMKLICCEILQS